MAFVFEQPGVSSMIVGTINPEHLRANIEVVNSLGL
jgi:aryl-alcohol dehydrogenase-like predicted oxidoreductase